MTDSPTGGSFRGRASSDDAAGPGTDWPKKAADTVDLVVDTVHDRAIRPILLAARAVVFGLLVAVLGLVVLVLLSVGLLRLLDVYAFPGRVWASYAVLGAAFVLVGLWLWTMRVARTGPAGQD